MKTILSSIFIFISFFSFGQDNIYTTFSTNTISGYKGIDTCQHEWFSTTVEVDDTSHFGNIKEIKKRTLSQQCIRCGKQISIEDIWTTYNIQSADTTSYEYIQTINSSDYMPNLPTANFSDYIPNCGSGTIFFNQGTMSVNDNTSYIPNSVNNN